MNKKIVLGVALPLVIIIGLALIIIFFLSNQSRVNDSKARQYALTYAQRDCKNKLGNARECDNLRVFVTPPADWGRREYIIDVESENQQKFNASVVLTVDIGGRVHLVRYDQPNVVSE